MARGYDAWYPPPSRPRTARGGIKAQSKRGTFGQKWWARRWVEVLEGFPIGARLHRGRTYARLGQVLSIDITPGEVRALVQGSRARPYRVTIRLAPLSKKEWHAVAARLATEARYAAKLLAGEMPEGVEDAFLAAGLSLFPRRHDDLRTECSCPDWSNPCKHIAAVYYLLAEEFDRDPFLLFTLRGLEREQLVELLAEAAPERAEGAASADHAARAGGGADAAAAATRTAAERTGRRRRSRRSGGRAASLHDGTGGTGAEGRGSRLGTERGAALAAAGRGRRAPRAERPRPPEGATRLAETDATRVVEGTRSADNAMAPLPADPGAFWGTTGDGAGREGFGSGEHVAGVSAGSGTGAPAGEGGFRGEESVCGREVRAPDLPAALPRSLGGFPFWQGERPLLDALEEIYRNASPLGLTVFLGEEGGMAEDEAATPPAESRWPPPAR